MRVPYELDSGCRGGNIIPGHLADQLTEATFRDVQSREVTSAEGKVTGTIMRMVRYKFQSRLALETEVGNLKLYHVTYYVSDTISVILFDDNLLSALLINPHKLLENIIASGCTEMDTLSGCAAVDVDSIETVRRMAARMNQFQAPQEPDSAEPSSSEVDLGPINVHEIETSCNRMVHQARLNGTSRHLWENSASNSGQHYRECQFRSIGDGLQPQQSVTGSNSLRGRIVMEVET